MIAVIDYGLTAPKNFLNFMNDSGIEYRFTSSESEILKCEKIVLPDSTDIIASVKQLHLLNLYSFLRMCSKPILGIGTGMISFTELLEKENISCLGLISVPAKYSNKQLNNYYKPLYICSSKLFRGVKKEDSFYLSTNYFLPEFEFSTSLVNVNDNLITLSFEKENVSGILFLPELSGQQGKQVILNFSQN